MIVCGTCAKLGQTYTETGLPRRTRRPIKPLQIPRRSRPPIIHKTLELLDDYSFRIRQSRQKLELSHKDLGREIGEKISVLKRIESGKMSPDNKLAEKLEHALKIVLLVPPTEQKSTPTSLSKPKEVTLGEVVHIRKRKMEATKKRKP